MAWIVTHWPEITAVIVYLGACLRPVITKMLMERLERRKAPRKRRKPAARKGAPKAGVRAPTQSSSPPLCEICGGEERRSRQGEGSGGRSERPAGGMTGRAKRKRSIAAAGGGGGAAPGVTPACRGAARSDRSSVDDRGIDNA